ncbi:MAG: hypothetical protein LBB39_02400 [Mycoplasmataceae bacterium]|nr:hypothetical protein [Mycoplasmataceae bacterium]
MSNEQKTVELQLRNLQKKLIINETLSQSFYTRFNDKSDSIFDFAVFLKKNNIDFAKIIKGEKITIDYSEENNDFFNKLKNLNNKNEKKIRESGVDSLFIGWPYITGVQKKTKIKDNDFSSLYRSPLFLWKVKIEFKSNIKVILCIEPDLNNEIKPILNLTLLSRISLENNKHINIFDVEILPFSDNSFTSNIFEFFKNIGLNFDKEGEENLFDILKNFTTKHFIDAKSSKVEVMKKIENHYEKIEPFCCLGIYSFKNASLIEMYNQIITDTKGIDFFIKMNQMFSLNRNNDNTFKEKDIKQITPLDYTQKLAIKKALSSNLVIQGPPGTGKSQTIANIIANAILNDKSVLFVSEKYVAAEVVEKRLGTLNNFSIPLFDLYDSENKNIFYDKVKKIGTLLSNSSSSYADHEKADDIDKKIDNDFHLLQQYSSFKRKQDTRINLEFLEKNYTKFNEYKKWSEELNENLNFENESEFWDFVAEYSELKQFYHTYIEIINNFHLPLERIQEICDITNFIDFRKMNMNFFDQIVTFIKKKKMVTKFSSIARKDNKKFYNKNKKLCDFFLSMNEDIKNKIGSFDLGKFNSYLEKRNHSRFLQLEIFLTKYNQSNFSFSELKQYIAYQEFCRTNQEILRFANQYSEVKNEIKKLMKEKMEFDTSFLFDTKLERLIAKRNEVENHHLLKDISDLVNLAGNIKKRNLDWVIHKFSSAIKELFPIIITNPDTAASLFREWKFDYVIIDEASQMTLERSIPMLYLAEKSIISGDKQQMPPSSFFMSTIEEEYVGFNDKVEDYIKDSFEEYDNAASLLEYVEKKYENIMLNYHYRSTKTELIQFSNVCFYGGGLVVADSSKDNKLGIELIEVEDGVWENGVNLKEAERVKELVLKLVRKPKHGSIGVITFNINQKNLIESLLEKSNDGDYLEEKKRINTNNEDNSIFIKNLENIQGDERDIIIISVAYAKDENGRFLNSFGPINQSCGENRINVAISRSKEKIYLFKSFNSSLINSTLNKGTSIFHDYLLYVELLANTKNLYSKEINALFSSYLPKPIAKNEKIKNEITFTSMFEKNIYDLLIKEIDPALFEVSLHVQQGSYQINIAIKSKKTKSYVLAIECDGCGELVNETQKEKDFYRQSYLEERGWKFYSIDLIEWYFNEKAQRVYIQEILSLVTNTNKE